MLSMRREFEWNRGKFGDKLQQLWEKIQYDSGERQEVQEKGRFREGRRNPNQIFINIEQEELAGQKRGWTFTLHKWLERQDNPLPETKLALLQSKEFSLT